VLAVGPGGRTVTFVGQASAESEAVPVRIWDAGDNSVRSIIPEVSGKAAYRQSSDGRWIVVGIGAADRAGTVDRLRIVDLATGDAYDWTGPAGQTRRLGIPRFAPDNRWLAFAEDDPSGDPAACFWDLARRRPAALLGDFLGSAVFSADGRRLAGWVRVHEPKDGVLEKFAVYDTATGRELARWEGERYFGIAALTPDGSALIGDSSGLVCIGPIPMQVKCWNVTDGRERWSVDAVDRWLSVEGGRRFVTHRSDNAIGLNEVVLVDADDGRTVRRIRLREGQALCDAAPDGRALLTVGDDRSVLTEVRDWLARHGLSVLRSEPVRAVDVIDAETGARLVALPYPDGLLGIFSPGGESLAVLDSNGQLTIWDIPPRKPLA
jgi:hypothetical protein